MAITFTHKSGSPGAGINIKLGTGKLLGRSSAGEGFVEEVTGPSGAIVGTSDTQTLTNKTITSAAFSGTHTGAFTTAGNIKVDSAGNAQLTADANASGNQAGLSMQTNGTNRWQVVKNNVAESGGDSGSDFNIWRFNDAGVYQDSPISIIRSTGNVTIANDLSVTGALSKGSGSFKIDHPLKPDTHHLVHSFIEGPQADLIYRGKVRLINGVATVNLDEAGRMTEGTFVALNTNVQCFTSNEEGWTPLRGSVRDNILTIEAQDQACMDEVSWMVIGERHDQHMFDTDWTDENGRVITEPPKEQINGSI